MRLEIIWLKLAAAYSEHANDKLLKDNSNCSMFALR